jgi:hypothetical protein
MRVFWVSALILMGCNGVVADPSDDDPGSDGPGATDGPGTGPGAPGTDPGIATDPDPNDLEQARLFECVAPEAARTAPRIRRLTPDQLLKRWPVSLSRSTPYASDPQYRYSTDARDALIDEDATAQLAELAIEAGAGMVASRTGWPACIRTGGSTDPACLADWAEGQLLRAYKRPPTDEEIAALSAYAEASVARLGFDDGLTLASAVPYVRPDFLFRTELGAGDPDAAGRRRLGDLELANAIAYALTDASAYDDPGDGTRDAMRALRDAALAGELRTAAEIEGHVRALFESDPSSEGVPRVPVNVLRFFREYLGYPDAPFVFKSGALPDPRYYGPAVFEPQLDAMTNAIVRADTDVLRTLLTTRTFWFSPGDVRTLAQDRNWPLNMEGPDQPMGWVTMPEDQRAGLLTHPGWLATHSSNQHTDPHPVHRGKWIRENMLCDVVPGVPIGVEAVLPDDPELPVRERLGLATRANEFCWSCHQLMDPLGLPFQMYDHYGRYRTEEVLADEIATVPVDASSTLVSIDDPALDGATVANAIELMELLASSEQVEGCFVRQTFRFFVGRPETYEDACTLAQMRSSFRDGGGSFADLLVALITSDSFLLRGPTMETEGGAL